MTDINKNSNTINTGGNCNVEYIFSDYIDSMPDPIDSSIDESSITLKTERSWSDFYGTPDSIGVNISPSSGDDGVKYTVTLTLRYPKDQLSITDELRKLVQRGIIIKYEDKNGTRQILGDIDTPLYFIFRTLKPASTAGYNGYDITFTSEFDHHPYYLI